MLDPSVNSDRHHKCDENKIFIQMTAISPHASGSIALGVSGPYIDGLSESDNLIVGKTGRRSWVFPIICGLELATLQG